MCINNYYIIFLTGLYAVIFVNQNESQTIPINVTQNGTVSILDKNHAISDYIKIGDNINIIGKAKFEFSSAMLYTLLNIKLLLLLHYYEPGFF